MLSTISGEENKLDFKKQKSFALTLTGTHLHQSLRMNFNIRLYHL